MRATNLVIALVCFLAAVTLMNGVLGPLLGIDIATGGDQLDETESDLEGDIDTAVTDDGGISPLSALDLLTSMVSHLMNADTILENFGIPRPIAVFLTSPFVFLAVIAIVSIVVRTRL